MKPGRIILLGLLLALGACRDDKRPSFSPPTFSARFERELKARVAAAKKEIDLEKKQIEEKKSRLHTIRITGFILLAGCSGVLLFRLQRQRGFHPTPTPERLPPVTQWQDHYPRPSTRVIDTQVPKQPDRQHRNSNPSPSTRRRQNPKRRRNHRHAPTPRP